MNAPLRGDARPSLFYALILATLALAAFVAPEICRADELTVSRNGVTYQWHGDLTAAQNSIDGNSGYAAMVNAESVGDGIFADSFAGTSPFSPWAVDVYTSAGFFLIQGFCHGNTGYGDDHGGSAVYVFCTIDDY
jgi:hypothetical protein